MSLFPRRLLWVSWKYTLDESPWTFPRRILTCLNPKVALARAGSSLIPVPEVWRWKREDRVDKGENTEKGRALQNAAQKKRDTNLNVKEQKCHDCPMDRDMESVGLNFIWRFAMFLNAITFIQADSTMGANKPGHVNSDHFCFSHCI